VSSSVGSDRYRVSVGSDHAARAVARRLRSPPARFAWRVARIRTPRDGRGCGRRRDGWRWWRIFITLCGEPAYVDPRSRHRAGRT